MSAAFILTLFLLGFLSVEWLQDSVQLHSHLNLEALLWSTAIGCYVLRYMTLGNKTHHKYRSVSVLITEQINLYLQVHLRIIILFLLVIAIYSYLFVFRLKRNRKRKMN